METTGPGVLEAELAATLRLHLLQGARASEDQHLHPNLFIYLFVQPAREFLSSASLLH